MGSYLFVQVSLIFWVADLRRLHLASRRIEAKIRAESPNVKRVHIQYDPRVKSILRYAVALQKAGERLVEHLEETPCLALANIHLQEIIDNLYHGLAMGKAPRRGPIPACVCVMPDIVITPGEPAGKGARICLCRGRSG